MQGSMRVILGTGLAFVLFVLLPLLAASYVASTTSAGGGAAVVVSYPSPEPHP